MLDSGLSRSGSKLEKLPGAIQNTMGLSVSLAVELNCHVDVRNLSKMRTSCQPAGRLCDPHRATPNYAVVDAAQRAR
jgi:hypothetical protein